MSGTIDLTAYNEIEIDPEYERALQITEDPHAAALLVLAVSIDRVAYQLRQLGNAGANTNIGAIEALGVVFKEGFDTLTSALYALEK